MRLFCILRRIADLTVILFTEDGRFMSVVFEFEQIVRRVFEKERPVLDTRAWETHSRLLIEGKILRLGPICQRLPFLQREKHQPEMTGVDPFLLRRLFLHEMCDKLMTSQAQSHRML